MLPAVLVTRLTEASVEEALERAVIRFTPELPANVRKIAIKVNLCDYRMAESGATTDPVMVRMLAGILHRRYQPESIAVVENDASAVEARSLFAVLGFNEALAGSPAELVSCADGEWIRTHVPGGLEFREIEVPRVIADADLVVNLAKLKTNALTKTTGCLKNLFGLLRAKRKSLLHDRIDGVIADVNRAIRSHLCLVDGMIGMQGRGPAFGEPRRCEVLIAGADPVAVDACCARMMGFSPRFVRHIRWCARAGVGRLRYRLETDIAGFRYGDYRFAFNRFESLARALLRRRLGLAS